MGEGGFSSDVLPVRFVHMTDPLLVAGRVWEEKEEERQENRVETSKSTDSPLPSHSGHRVKSTLVVAVECVLGLRWRREDYKRQVVG